MTISEFYFIRHGETDWNLESRTMGQKDIPLNNTGKLQAGQAATLLKKYKIKTICYSPLSRAKETALILNDILHCPLVEIDVLKECGWGVLEGKLKTDGQYLNQWMNGITPEGAESCESFKERAMEGIKSSLVYPNPLIVSHGGIYWAVQQILCKKIYRSRAENCLPFHFSLSEKNGWINIPLDESFDEEPFET